MKNKITTPQDAIANVKDGMIVMIGGFLGNGTPELMIEQIIKKGLKNLTIIANDTAFPDRGIGKLIVNKCAKKVIVSHIGTNPETGRQMNEKEVTVELVPQGTLAEQIRAGGGGLGGILTTTGIGTVVEEGKQKIAINDKDYLLELPLYADVAIIKGTKIDKQGNVFYNKSTRNFNPLMATAANFVIAECDEIVEVGQLDPNYIITPSILVDLIVNGRDN